MYTIELSSEERDEILKLLENDLADTKIELRRTRNPEWREKLQQEEDMLISLVERLKQVAVS